MQAPEELVATHYLPDGSFQAVEAKLLEPEIHAMDTAFDLADQALQSGNPPVGAVLLDRERSLLWAASTADKTDNHIVIGHAEVRAYHLAQPTVGDRLEDCTLVTTCQPCSSCTPPYAEGKIGRIIYAASRTAVWETTNYRLMRSRRINMHELLADGATDTVVIGGYRQTTALAKFVRWTELHPELTTK